MAATRKTHVPLVVEDDDPHLFLRADLFLAKRDAAGSDALDPRVPIERREFRRHAIIAVGGDDDPRAQLVRDSVDLFVRELWLIRPEDLHDEDVCLLYAIEHILSRKGSLRAELRDPKAVEVEHEDQVRCLAVSLIVMAGDDLYRVSSLHE